MPAHLLIIEDNAANLELVSYLLKMGGHTITTANDGRQGLDFALQEPFELILCDLQMPVMDGFAFLSALREHARLDAVPVIAVTAFSMPGDRGRVMSAGFDGYLSKPIQPESFVAQIESWLPPYTRPQMRNDS